MAPYDQKMNASHYCDHPSGVECAEIAEGLPYGRGNALKYIWRAGKKESRLKDLKKARWYLENEIDRLREQSRKLEQVLEATEDPNQATLIYLLARPLSLGDLRTALDRVVHLITQLENPPQGHLPGIVEVGE